MQIPLYANADATVFTEATANKSNIARPREK